MPRPNTNATTFMMQLDAIIDERKKAAEKRQRDLPTRCGTVQHAGFTCREFDTFLCQQIDGGVDVFGRFAAMLEQHQGYDPTL